MTRIGPYELIQPFASGAMGEVWKGRHVSHDVEVVAKLISRDLVQDPQNRDLFRREVQAAARLRHKNIVAIYDYGLIPQDIEASESIVSGAPYFVMEFAPFGALTNYQIEDFETIQQVLAGVLRALSHSHARGVIHRDIKPDNVVLFDQEGKRAALTDFGIAHALEKNTRSDSDELTSRNSEDVSGTPRYMAPEQFMGHWRDYGPWTDLYAVGIMAWELVCRDIPYKGSNFFEIAHKHIQEKLPSFSPKVSVPGEFQPWLERLLEKHPRDRFQHAADALRALAKMKLVTGSSFDGVGDVATIMVDLSALQAPTAKSEATEAIRLPSSHADVILDAGQGARIVPGLGLLGLRSIRVMGRDEELATLWSRLRHVHESGTPHAVLIRGATGTGKTRLAEYFSHLAAEAGAATILKACFSAEPTMVHGFGWMLVEHFRCAGMRVDDIESRLSDLDPDIPADEAAALAQLMQHDENAGTESVGRAQQQELILRALKRLGRDRPVVLTLDDVHHDRESLTFVERALEEEGLPLLVLLTEVQERSAHTQTVTVERLAIRDNVDTFVLDALSPQAMSQLVRLELGLDGPVAAEVEKRSEGSPLFAIQLVEEWQPILESDGETLRLTTPNPPLPAHLSDLWIQRLQRLIDGWPPDSQDSLWHQLEAAAALGREVQLNEFEAVLENLRLTLTPFFVDELANNRLAELTGHGFAFIHGLLRDTLRERAVQKKRARAIHLACARVLASLYPESHPGLARRVARHFVEAGAYMVALMGLEEAMRRARHTLDAIEAQELADLMERVLLGLNTPPTDGKWAIVYAHRAIAMITSARSDDNKEGQRLLQEAKALARQGSDPDSLAVVLALSGWSTIHSRELEEGVSVLEEALQLASRQDTTGLVYTMLAHVHSHRRDPRATEYATMILEGFEVPAWRIKACEVLAHKALEENQPEVAETYVQDALTLAESTGKPELTVFLRNLSGFVQDARGQFTNAEKEHRRALELASIYMPGSGVRHATREYIVRCLVHQGRIPEAKSLLTELTSALSMGDRGLYLHLHDIELAIAIADGDWEKAHNTLAAATTFSSFPPNALHGRMLHHCLTSLSTAHQIELFEGLQQKARAAFQDHPHLKFWQDAICA